MKTMSQQKFLQTPPDVMIPQLFPNYREMTDIPLIPN
jgi:hypothetical protein